MLTVKKQAAQKLILFVCAVTLFAGCRPPGPVALLQGKKLLEEGKYPQAVEKLKTATTLLSTNAQAWNYLGLACHQAGQPADAEKAYRRALMYDPDLSEAHYNLGCLWLDQNRLDLAKTEFTAFTMRRANSPEGLVRLGQAQLRAGDLAAAEKNLADAARLSPQNAEALTGLGLIRVQRRHPDEAAQYFAKAIKAQPDYGPAILNLAIVQQQYLNDRLAALRGYREYLALKPAPPNSDLVRGVTRQLEQELSPTPQPLPVKIVPTIVPTNAVVQTHTNPPPPKSNPAPPAEPAHPVVQTKPVVTNTPRIIIAQKPEIPPPTKTIQNSNPPKSVPLPETNVESVKLNAEPVFKPAQDISAPMPANAVSNAPRQTPASASNELASAKAPTNTDDAPLDPSKIPRYPYHKQPALQAGNRTEAERAFAQGVQSHSSHGLREAIQAYRRATQLDPSYFDAYYNLGLACTELGSLGMALSAYETALKLRPDSLDGRYNFALVLKQANYPLDAATELEKILVKYPNESRAHLALGNLFAQQLRQPAQARQHYLKVLESDPRNPQAGAIRYWLSEH
jgi:tetratricopeptide (TPR) repeat protein